MEHKHWRQVEHVRFSKYGKEFIAGSAVKRDKLKRKHYHIETVTCINCGSKFKCSPSDPSDLCECPFCNKLEMLATKPQIKEFESLAVHHRQELFFFTEALCNIGFSFDHGKETAHKGDVLLYHKHHNKHIVTLRNGHKYTVDQEILSLMKPL